jgi:hypothetical protein
MATRTKTPKNAWQKLGPDERQEVRRFISFLESRNSKADPAMYVNPVSLVLLAASQAESMRHETYSVELLHKIAAHNETKLVPALCQLMQWALDLQREVNQINAKLIRQAKAKKGGKRAKRAA